MRDLSMLTEDLFSVISNMIGSRIAATRVGTLARITSVEGDSITVKPVIREKIKSPTGYRIVELPEITDVRLCRNQYPKVGDYVICVHGDKTPEEFDEEEGTAVAGKVSHGYNDVYAFVLNFGSEWSPVEIERLEPTVPGFYTFRSESAVNSFSEIRVLLKNGNRVVADQILKMDLLDFGVDSFDVMYYNGGVSSLVISITSEGKLEFTVSSSFTLEYSIQAR